MPTGIGNGIAGDVFQNNLGAGGGGGLVCPSRYSWLGDGTGFGGPWGAMLSGVYDLGATSSSASIWYKPIDIRGATNLGAGLYSTDAAGVSFSGGTNIYTSPSGVLTASLGPMIFPAHPELITNGSFTNVPVGTELIANPTFSDAASITPWNTTGAPNATLSWNARFMRMTYTVANGNALFDNMGQTLNTMYSVKMRVRGVTSAGADQGSAFDAIGDNTALTSANIISNPTLTSEYQDYEFRVWSTDISFRFYLATAAIGDVVDFDSISVKPLDMLVDNGNFGNGTTDWSNDGSSTISVGTHAGRDDVADINITGTGTGDRITQPFTWTEGKSYKVDVEVYVVSGSFRVDTSDGFVPGNFVETTTTGSWQTLTGYITATATGPNYLFVRSLLAISQFYVDSISIEELGEDWTLGTGWSIGDDVASCDGTQTSNSLIYQNIGSQSNKTVKFSFTVTDYVSGVLETAFFGASGTIAETISANGNYTFDINVQSGHNGNTGFTAKVGFAGSITNISVSEVLSENEWHHLALSIDRDSEWKWYVDGVLTNTMDNATDVAPLSGISTLGLTNVSTAIPSFYGNMTEPSLWNIPLSSSEVKDIYDNMYGGQRCLDILPFSSDLITNGNFSQIGPELILNGDFSATINITIANYNFATGDMTGWNTSSSGDGVTPYYSDGGALISNGATGGQSAITQPSILEDAKSYKISYRIVSNDGGGLNLNGYGVFDSTVGIHSFYIVGLAAYTTLNIKRSGSNVNIVITDIVVEELGEDWTLTDSIVSATPAGVGYYTDDGSGANAYAYQTILDSTKNYKTSFEILEFPGAGAVGISSSTTAGGFYPSAVGTFEKFLCPPDGSSPTQFRLVGNPPAAGFKMTNASVKEVGQGWDADGTGSGVVTFPNGMARIETVAAPNSAYIRQYSVMEVGKSYTMTYRIVSNNGGTLYNSGQTPTTMDSTVGSHSETFIAGSSNLLISRFGNNTDISITNITLTQVGSGNLERWWRMNGTEPLLITLPNVAPNGTVNDLIPQNVPIIQLDTP